MNNQVLGEIGNNILILLSDVNFDLVVDKNEAVLIALSDDPEI